MERFLNSKHDIMDIQLACFVAAGTGNPRHRARSSHGLAINLDGRKEYRFLNGKTLTVDKNSVIFLPQGSNYDVVDLAAGACYAINFTLHGEDSFQPFAVTVKNSARVIDAFRSAERAYRRKSVGYEDKCKSVLYEVLFVLQQEYHESYLPSDKLNIILPAVDYIHKNYYKETVCIQKLCSECGISHEYFRILFRRFYGQSPVKYINALRISRAKDLLKSGYYTVTEIAVLTGYGDAGRFSREFKKATGLSPTKFICEGSVSAFD